MRIRVATYNVGLLKILWHEAVPLAFERSKVLQELLPTIAVEQQIQVIALQEVWAATDLGRFKAAFERRNYRCLTTPKHGWFGSGLMLFIHESLPVSWARFHPFGSSASWDRFVQKGGIFSAVELEKRRRLVIGNAHLQAFTQGASRRLKKHELIAHKNQINVLRSVLSSIHDPVLLLGDFNVGPPHHLSLFERLKRRLSLSSASGEDQAGAVGPTWSQENPLVSRGYLRQEKSGSLDHCLIRGTADFDWKVHDVAVALDGQHADLKLAHQPVPPSDHYALVVELELLSTAAGLRRTA